MLIGLDAGTSVVKAVAFDLAGEAVAIASRPTRTISPAPGHAEQDLEEVVAAVAAVVREVTVRAGERPELIGITAQGDGLWLLDAEGRAVRRPILWSDARAAGIVAEWMASGLAERIFRRSLNMTFPGAAAPLLVALREAEPDAVARATTAGYCKDAIVQRLTGVRATDASDASLPFADVRLRTYDRDLIAMVGLAGIERLLAPIDPSPGPLRSLDRTGADLLGLPQGMPVHAGPFDLCATMIGAGVDRPGDGLVILGTTLGCAVLVERLAADTPPAGMTLCMPRPDRWARVMPAMVGTPSVEWVLSLIGRPRGDLDALLAESPPGARGTVALPLLSSAGERAPFVDPAARGSFTGLSLETAPADLVRAVCEGIAYMTRWCLDAAGLAPDGDVVVSGGGSRSTAWRQILADVLGRPLEIARPPEVGARGAVLAALEAAGWDVDRERWTEPAGSVAPDPARRSLYDEGYAFFHERLDSSRGRWSGPTESAVETRSIDSSVRPG